MKVYMITENWDNLETCYDDTEFQDIIIGIASTEERALERIDNRISHLKKVVENEDGGSFEYGIDHDQKYLIASNDNYITVRKYTWEIKSYEIDNFDLVDKELYI